MVKKDLITSNLLNLTSDQFLLLFSLENLIILEDIKLTKNLKNKYKKDKWHQLWLDTIKMYFPEIVQDSNKKFNIYTEEQLINMLNNDKNNDSWFSVILTEAVLFSPYFNLMTDTELIEEKTNNNYSKLSFSNIKSIYKYIDTLLVNVDSYTQGFIYKITEIYKKEYKKENHVLVYKNKSKNIFSICLLFISIIAVFVSPLITTTFIYKGFDKAKVMANLILLLIICLIVLSYCISSIYFNVQINKNIGIINSNLRFIMEIKLYQANNREHVSSLNKFIDELVKFI